MRISKQETLQYQRNWWRKRYATDMEFRQKCVDISRKWRKDPDYAKKQKIAFKRWCQKNKPWLKTKYKQYSRLYYQKNRNKFRQYARKHRNKNRDRINEHKREYARNNPRSGTNYSIELQIAMNNVRKRDNNTCQWQNCGLTHKETTIHVNHSFPRSEYPELELIEKYMICYCRKHHGIWHEYRGDNYSHMINSIEIHKGDSNPNL